MQKRIFSLAAVTALILLVPLVAMQLTDEVVWTLSDFIFAGALMFGTGLAYLLAVRKAGNLAYRAAIGLALAAMFLLVWVNGAVGIIGSEDNPANLLYFGVVAIGLLGAAITRLKPRGMMVTLVAMIIAQVAVPLTALSDLAFRDTVKVVQVSAFFVLLLAASALLFREAGEQETLKSS